MQIYMNSELRLKNLDTKYLHNSYIFTRFTKLNRNFTHSLFAECVINGPRLYLCVLNGQYVFAKNELTNLVVQDATGMSDCRSSTQEMACGTYSRTELRVNKAPNGLNKYCPF